MKTLLLLFASLLTYISVPANRLTEIKKKKAEIDQYEFKHRKEMITLLKLEGKNKLIKSKTEDLPDDAEYVYNVLKDGSGHIILIEQIPCSQSGDWYIEWKHYFDTDGNTFCFSNRQSIFNDDVKGGVVVEETVNYYNTEFKQIESKSRLTDKDDKTMSQKKNEFDFRDYKYNIYKNANECMKAFHIILNK
mgnify:CR=1 FL=1|jgi:hypothetical protein